MTNIQTNTSLESVLDNKQDQLKLRDFNDLNKKDVITTVKMLVASKDANAEIKINPSANVDKKHYSFNEDDLNEIQSKYEDDESDLSRDLASYLNDKILYDAENQIDIDEIVESSEIETEIKEISVDEAVRTINNTHNISELSTDDVTDENKKSLLSNLNLSLDDYAVELVSKDNVPTFVIIKKDKSIKDQIESIRDSLNSTFSDTLESFKKIDEVMLELYDDEKSIYESLKIFLERFDKEVNKDVLYLQEEEIVDDLRKLFKTLESQSENTSQ